MPTMHNIMECHWYKMDNTAMQSLIGQSAQNVYEDKNYKKLYAQMVACIEKVEKSLKNNIKGKTIDIRKKVTVIPTLPEAMGPVVTKYLYKIIIIKIQQITLPPE